MEETPTAVIFYVFFIDRCRGRVVRAGMVKKVAGSNSRSGQLASGNLSLSTQQRMGIFLESGKDK